MPIFCPGGMPIDLWRALNEATVADVPWLLREDIRLLAGALRDAVKRARKCGPPNTLRLR